MSMKNISIYGFIFTLLLLLPGYVDAANVLPKASAGADQTITLPANNITLQGAATDPDGTIANYTWTKVSGSGTVLTSSINAWIVGLTQGTSVFKLTVTDDMGGTASDEVTVTVKPAPAGTPTDKPSGDPTDTPSTTTDTKKAVNTPGQASGFLLDVKLQNPLKVNTITEAVAFFVNTLIKIAIPFIVIFFIWAGLQFILARGNAEKIGKAKKMFLYTVIGTLLILGAWTITNAIIGTVNSIVG